MKRRDRRVDRDRSQNETVGPTASLIQRTERHAPTECQVHQQPGKEKPAAGHMHKHIPIPCGQGAWRVTGPDHDQRGQRHQLPPDEGANPIARVDDAQGPTGVDECGRMLAALDGMPRVKHADDGDQGEDHAEQLTQRIDSQELKLEIADGVAPVCALRQQNGRHQRGNRTTEQEGCSRRPWDPHQESRSSE